MSLSDSEPSVSYSVIGIWSVSIFLTSESVDPGLSDSINWFISKNGLLCGRQRETPTLSNIVLTYRFRGGRIPQARSSLSAYFSIFRFFVLVGNRSVFSSLYVGQRLCWVCFQFFVWTILEGEHLRANCTFRWEVLISTIRRRVQESHVVNVFFVFDLIEEIWFVEYRREKKKKKGASGSLFKTFFAILGKFWFSALIWWMRWNLN